MGKFILSSLLGLALCAGAAQPPVVRSAWTTNAPGVWNAEGSNITFYPRRYNENPFTVVNNAGQVVFMIRSNGSAGVWTATPQYQLEVNGYAYVGALIVAGTQPTAYFADITAGAHDYYLFADTNFFGLHNDDSGLNAWVVNTLGNFGLGVDSPATRFHVVGGVLVDGQQTNTATIRATNVVVSPPEWDDVRIPLTTLSNPADQPGKVKVATGAHDVYSYGFDPDADEMVAFELQLPHGIDTNNAYGIRIHIHYTGLTVPNHQSNIVWGLDYMVANTFSRFNTVPVTMYATNGLTGVTNHMLAAFWYPITNITESAVIFGTLFRDANNPADLYPADAIGLSFDAHYPRRQMGSSAEYGDY